MTARHSITVRCDVTDCDALPRHIEVPDMVDALKALILESGWSFSGPLHSPSRAYCPVHSAARRAEARVELARVAS